MGLKVMNTKEFNISDSIGSISSKYWEEPFTKMIIILKINLIILIVIDV